MGHFTDNLKHRFRQKDILIQLILINVAVFLLLGAFQVVTTLFKLDTISLLPYIGISPDVDVLLSKPWTVITYMIVHQDVWHILFNMLMLFWFGQLFLSYFNPKQLGSLYFLGGIGGAILYILAFNTIPYYVVMAYPLMIGASASVTAIIFAAAFYKPQQQVRMFLLGEVRISYIALFIFLLDFISLGSQSNAGGHVAHIGGAAVGYIFATQYLKGRDLTRWISRCIDWIANLSKAKPPRMKVKVSNKKADDYDYNARRNKQSEEIDHILDKIKMSGYTSLNKEEKKKLFDASKK